MESDPLQQLRDIHLPLEPSWWPPAVGWWLLVLLTLALCTWLITKAVQWYRRRAPIRGAKALLKELHRAYRSGHIDAEEFLHESNELLKRLLVRAYKQNEYAPLSGQAWLTALDQLGQTNHFSNGPGRVLGEARFSAQPNVDVEDLYRTLESLLARMRPYPRTCP